MRIFLVAPEFETLGGFEAQLTALAAGLVRAGDEVYVFIRRPVAGSHPYWQQMQAAGVRLWAPARLAASLLAPPLGRRRAVLQGLLALAAPLLLPLVLLDMLRRRRSWGRSWQGARGRLHGGLSKLLFFDGLNWWLERQMDRTARRNRPDLIDVQHSMIPEAILYGRRRDLPTIYTEYGAPDKALKGVWDGLAGVVEQADFIIGRSEASFAGLRTLFGVERPSALVPNAVVAGPEAGEGDPALPVEDNPVVITAVGRLAPEKGPGFLLEAFYFLHREGLPVRLILAGDGPLCAELAAQATAWELSEWVTFTGPFDRLAPIMAITHIVAHPTLNDGRSVSVLEAMAGGRPVVASSVGGVRELISDGENGLLTPPADGPALAQALKRLVLDSSLRRQMGRAARRRFAAGSYSPESMVAQTREIYEAVAGGRQIEAGRGRAVERSR